MKAEVAADIFRRWAIVEGFAADKLAKMQSLTQAEAAVIKPVTEAGKGLLRARQVQGVAFNDVTNTVVVLLRKAVPGVKRAAMSSGSLCRSPACWAEPHCNRLQ
jgi:hypothetical protein